MAMKDFGGETIGGTEMISMKMITMTIIWYLSVQQDKARMILLQRKGRHMEKGMIQMKEDSSNIHLL